MQFDPMLMQSMRGAQFNQPRTPRGPVNDVVPGGPGGFGPPPGVGFQDFGPPMGGQFGPPPPMNPGFPGMPGGFGPPPMQTGFGEKPGFNPNVSVREQFAAKPVMGAQGQLQNMQGDPRARNRRMGAEMLKRARPTPKIPQAEPTQPGGSAPFNPMSIY